MEKGKKTRDGKDHVFLIDGSGYIFRAYHALPPLSRKSDGLPVGAVSGFCNMLDKLLKDTKDAYDPTHLAVIFDAGSKTFRNDIYPDYKAHRPPAPEDLVPQFDLIKQAVRAFGVPSIEMQGFEADDIIATFACSAARQGACVTIVSSDKDLMQLVGGGIDMLDTMKNRAVGTEEVRNKFGVTPDKVIDVQALAGDASDNVPGVPGIGIKTAALLINEYGDLDTLLERAEEIKQKKRRENLIAFAEQARISRQLVTLRQDVPVETRLEDMRLGEPDKTTLIGFLKSMEFTTLVKRLADHYGIDPDTIPPTQEAPARLATTGKSDVLSEATKKGGKPGATARGLEGIVDTGSYAVLTTEEMLQEWVDLSFAQGYVALDTETDSLDAMRARLVGVSLALSPGKACYIPLQHDTDDALGLVEDPTPQIPPEKALACLKPLLEDPGVLKIGQNLKYDLLVLKQHGIHLAPLDDTMLMSYALDAGLHGHGMDELSRLFLGHTPIPFKAVAGSGKTQITFDKVPVQKAAQYAAEDADVTLRLHGFLKPRLVPEHKMTLYETQERALVPVLVNMEHAGIKIDRTILTDLSSEFAKKISACEAEIHTLAGEEFNVGSPKQLGEILFGKMGIPGGRKTKTGAWSTGADTLETLAATGHALPVKVLEWRVLSKLKSTYTDALPGFIHPETGRVHTSYSMASTTTGRLASTDPNLQNIPIRTEDGRRIRTAFIAEKNNKLVSADYSQIELRLLAHIADVPELRQAFAQGMDIHAMTASEVFGVPVKDMDPATRRKAKAINFGIIYGISAFGLANQLKIARNEAAEYIDLYFRRFPGIRTYMEETRAFAHKHGYVETLFGRKIHLPEISSRNAAHRAFLERAAINAPIQGSAADIIRRAMIRMPHALKDAGLQAQMLLQVHDELIFETPAEEAKKTCALVSRVMANACEPVLALSVTLEVEAQAADNWDEAH